MRVLLSTIGSRGDVQPLVALGSELKALGHDVMLCVPPDFREWIEGLGMPVTPIGPELRSTGKARSSGISITAEQRRRMQVLVIALLRMAAPDGSPDGLDDNHLTTSAISHSLVSLLD